MIIFGISVFYFFGLIGRGQFHCPNCGGDRNYEHRTARRFFTLFFLPVIPLDKVGEVVQCLTCRVRFDPVVLKRPTTAQLASSLPAGMRAAATVILRAGGASEAATRLAVEAVRRAGSTDYDLTQLHADLSLPPGTAAEPLQTLAAQLKPEVCERWLEAATKIGLADGPLTQAERDGLRWIAGNLGLSPAHAHGVISTTEQAVTQR